MRQLLHIPVHILAVGRNLQRLVVLAGKLISHWPVAASSVASWPLTSTRLTSPLSADVPRTSSLPPACGTMCVMTVGGGRSSTGSSSSGNATSFDLGDARLVAGQRRLLRGTCPASALYSGERVLTTFACRPGPNQSCR